MDTDKRTAGRRRLLAVSMLFLAIAILAALKPSSTAASEDTPALDLIGGWEGEWGGYRVQMVITGQNGSHVQGTMTVEFIHFGTDTGPMKGNLKIESGEAVLTIRAAIHGQPRFEITKVHPSRLEGWGSGRRHRGKIILSRQ